jgi:hypothetical protein
MLFAKLACSTALVGTVLMLASYTKAEDAGKPSGCVFAGKQYSEAAGFCLGRLRALKCENNKWVIAQPNDPYSDGCAAGQPLPN